MRFRVALGAFVAVSAAWVAAPRGASAEVTTGIGASFSEGVTIETSGMHRANAGGVFLFGARVAIEAMIDVEAWSRWLDDKGMTAKGGGVTLGGRFAVSPEGRLRGLAFTGGATYLRLLGDAEKRLDNQLGRADIGPNAFAFRVGVAYGFPASKDITMIVKLDVNYWLIDGGEFPPEKTDPHPNPVSFHLALELMRWL
jgi:hypothetical protein